MNSIKIIHIYLLFLIGLNLNLVSSIENESIKLGPKIILKEYDFKSPKEVTRTIVFKETLNEIIVRNYKFFKIVLDCSSNQNVEWIYSGEGSPSLVKESFQIIKNSTSYTVLSSLSFIYDNNDEDSLRKIPFHTGLYTCFNKEKYLQNASIYLYFPRNDGKVLIEDENTPSKIINVKNITTGPKIVNFPCISTDPLAQIHLYKKHFVGNTTNRGVLDYEKITQNITYSPKNGFNLHYNSIDSLIGEYICSDESQRQGIVFDVILDRELRIFPNTSIIVTSSPLNLTCESNEPVFITTSLYANILNKTIENRHNEDEDIFNDSIETQTEKTESESYVASHVEEGGVEGDVGEIQCVAEKSGIVLHSWLYQIISKESDKEEIGLKYNETTKTFTCKSKLSENGKLSFILCDNPTECKVNSECFERSEHCSGYSKVPSVSCELDDEFICRKLTHYRGNGFIKCSEDVLEKIIPFADLPTSLIFGRDFESILPSEGAILEFEKKNFKIGDLVRVYLKKWDYLFIKQHSWASLLKNGTVVLNQKFNNLSSAKFMVTQDLKFIECSLILRKDLKAYKVSIPVIA